jgi:2-polyprenyl-6-methoxyphenol hydroxylase-like FAD-dependent oxidoreductase
VIAGAGPAGMMLGFLLARAGIPVTVLEKHTDFLRDFRGDTVHPSTLEIMHELGLLDDFLKLPHSEVRSVSLQIGKDRLTIGNFETLPTRCKFIALMPQWDFLNFLAARGKAYPTLIFACAPMRRTSSATVIASSACARTPRTASWKSTRNSLSVATAGIRHCARAQDWKATTSVRRLMCCGSV